MPEYMHLVGAEGLQNAIYSFRDFSDRFTQNFDGSVDRFCDAVRKMDEIVTRLEQLKQEKTDGC